MDDGFWYSVPDSLADELAIGKVVRVPLGGRRVRGWVVEVGERESSDRLKDVLSISGSGTVFDKRLLSTLEWASNHYIAPLSVVLNKAMPPNLPRQKKRAAKDDLTVAPTKGVLAPLVAALTAGQKVPAQIVVQRWQSLEWLGDLVPLLEVGSSVLVVAATSTEVDRIGGYSTKTMGRRVVQAIGENKDIAAAWTASQQPGTLLIGTPRITMWSNPHLKLAIVLEDSRRAMKERQTPTLHARDVVRRRSLVEAFTPVFFGPTPSVEVLAAGPTVIQPPGRPWPLVEVVDRSEETPISGRLAPRSIAALNATASNGLRAFVFSSKATIDAVRQEALSRLKRHASDSVMFGSERDLASATGFDLAVAVNTDGWLMGRSHRSGEEALRILARLANSVAPGPGRRTMLQTTNPDAPLIEALRRAEPIPYLESVLVDRARNGLPPASEMLVVEIRGAVPDGADEDIAALGAEVMGPLQIEGGLRWLLQGDLRDARESLRTWVAKWRDSGATVRIDADPIDL